MMWRDILIILGFVLNALYFFGLTPKRFSEYTGTAKANLVKRTFCQRIFLLLDIIASLLFVLIMIYTYKAQRFDLIVFLSLLPMLVVMWAFMLADIWKISEKGKRKLDIVIASVAIPSLIAAIILSDALLWQKFAYSIGGACIGYGLGTLGQYIRKRPTRI